LRQVTAVNGIATFPPFFATTPTVYVSNSSTNAPYAPDLDTLLDNICCKSAWKAFPANPSKADAVYSQPYHVFRTLTAGAGGRKGLFVHPLLRKPRRPTMSYSCLPSQSQSAPSSSNWPQPCQRQ